MLCLGTHAELKGMDWLPFLGPRENFAMEFRGEERTYLSGAIYDVHESL